MAKEEKIKEKKKYTLWGNILYIYKVLFREVRIAPLFLFGGIIIGVVMPLVSTLITTVAVSSITNGDGVTKFIVSMLVILSVYGVLLVVNRLIGAWNEFGISHVQSRRFLMDLVMKSFTTDYDNIEPQKQQALLNGASHSVNVYRQGVSLLYYSFPAFLSAIIGVVLYAATITVLDVRILIFIIVTNIVTVLLDLRAVKVDRSFNEGMYKMWGRMYYLQRCCMSAESGKDIRIYRMRNWFLDGFRREVNWNHNSLITKSKSWALGSMSGITFSVVRDLISYAILVTQVLNGSITIAEATFGIGIIAGFSNWLGQLQWSWTNMNSGSTNLIDYRRMIDFPDKFLRETGIGLDQIPEAEKQNGIRIEFQHVYFRYDEKGPDILKDVNFTIEPGEKIALVGHNGAGKTTLIKLLCGLYHPTGGQILVCGHSIEEYNLEDYQKLLATVFQDVNILPYSILSNVSGQEPEDTDRERVLECLKNTGLWEDVEKLPHQEMTYMTQTFAEDGVLFSGGMQQKLMMARAMYKDSPALILDEPTAALDPIAESRLYEEYNDFSDNKTSIFISHRLASTRFCDRIIYLEDGTVTEEGTHEQLLRNKGKYAHVFEVQSQYYQEESHEAED